MAGRRNLGKGRHGTAVDAWRPFGGARAGMALRALALGAARRGSSSSLATTWSLKGRQCPRRRAVCTHPTQMRARERTQTVPQRAHDNARTRGAKQASRRRFGACGGRGHPRQQQGVGRRGCHLCAGLACGMQHATWLTPCSTPRGSHHAARHVAHPMQLTCSTPGGTRYDKAGGVACRIGIA